MCPSLLRQANAKGETPLHIASRYGHVSTVKVLIEHEESPQKDLESGVTTMVKEMLKMTNKEKHTALHEAARNNHLAVVKLLIEKGPGISYSANGETPLYIAVERNFKDLVFEILESCTSPTHGGPLGRTTLHAAIIWNDKGIS
ncbi:protein ACCELERATED CELL DEATH 6-like [Fagus crenata]